MARMKLSGLGGRGLMRYSPERRRRPAGRLHHDFRVTRLLFSSLLFFCLPGCLVLGNHGSIVGDHGRSTVFMMEC